MITYKVITTRKETEDEVICDSCGKSCMKEEYEIDNPANPDYGHTMKTFEFMELKATWGYYSNKDGEKWIAQICESCVDTKLSVLINFQKKHYM